jgi:hypothetical protein
MTAITVSTPYALLTASGAAHKAKLARLERAMQSRSPAGDIVLIDRINAIEIRASQRCFYGNEGEKGLRYAFNEAAEACGY